MEIFLLRKNDDNTSVLQVFVSVQGNAGQICGDLRDDKKKVSEKGILKKQILYLGRIKITLNLIR